MVAAAAGGFTRQATGVSCAGCGESGAEEAQVGGEGGPILSSASSPLPHRVGWAGSGEA